MKTLFFAGSLRHGSYNQKFLECAYRESLSIAGTESELVQISQFPIPLYNQDIEDRGFPDAVLELAKKVSGVGAVVISSPENNGSISATLKNTVDWLSRPPLNPWPGKFILLLGATTGPMGAIRGLWHSRQPFEVLGCHVFPQMLGLPSAQNAFDENGELKDPRFREKLQKLLREFFSHANSFQRS